MTEVYNSLFVTQSKFAPAQLKQVLTNDLAPVWEIFGKPSDLMSLNVARGQEIHTQVVGEIDERLLVCANGTLVSLRGDTPAAGTVQYYALGHFGAIAVSRPFNSMRPEHRVDWLRLLWLRLLTRGVLLGAAGRELEMSAHEAEASVRDWRQLRKVRFVENFVVSSELVAGEQPRGAIIVEGGFLIRELVDRDGGSAVH